MRKTAMPVAANMPPMTTVPKMRRDIAPAPEAVQSGTQPRMKAKEVIKMGRRRIRAPVSAASTRSEEHTSELQSHSDLVCRLLLEKKKKKRHETKKESSKRRRPRCWTAR